MISGEMEFALLALCSVLLMVMGACEIAVPIQGWIFL